MIVTAPQDKTALPTRELRAMRSREENETSWERAKEETLGGWGVHAKLPKIAFPLHDGMRPQDRK